MYKIIGADGKEYGPISGEQVRQWITEGRANGQTVAQLAGTTDWKPLSFFPEFAPLLASAPSGLSPQPMPAGPPVSIQNYLVHAILVTLCCCVPFGIVAIVYAAQVNTKLALGDYAGAETASNNAKKWCWLGLGFGITVSLFWVAMQIVAVFAR